MKTPQWQRIAIALIKSKQPISAPKLARIASGRGGFCLSLSREISRCRHYGHNVVKVYDTWRKGKRNTSYQIL